MKKTINTNLGGFVFHIDEDAFQRLEKYLNALKAKFSNIDEQIEIIEDIEYRLAEIFSEKLKNKIEVVTLTMVNEAISQLGEADEIGNDEEAAIPNRVSSVKKRLFRDPDDKVIGGVISGICQYFGFDHIVLARLGFIFLTLASVGFPGVLIYLILWIIIPKAATTSEKLQMKGEATTLENIEETVRKKIQSADISKVATDTKNTAKKFIKIIAMIIAGFLAIKLFFITLAFVTGGLALSILVPEIISLGFPGLFQFNLGTFFLWLVVAVPIIYLIIFITHLVSRRNLHIKATGVLLLFAWLLGVVGVVIIALQTASNFKTEAVSESIVEMPNHQIERLYLEIPEREFHKKVHVQFNNHFFNTEGFYFSENHQSFLMENVKLSIKPALNDSLYRIEATYKTRGKNLEDAETNLKNINHDLHFTTDSTLVFPSDITVNTNSKFRMQEVDYVLFIPEGKKISFMGNNTAFVAGKIMFNGDYTKKQLPLNTWEMTSTGLICLTCEE
jgi:phage shock protein PspC (stress-responsive transcriptional regulator)